MPGTSTAFNFTATPVSIPFNLPIVFTATGLPTGATATFSPATATLGSSPANVTMTVKTTVLSATLHRYPLLPGGSLALVFLLLPLTAKLRRHADSLCLLRLSLFAVLSLGAVTLITGCGTGSGFFGQPQQTSTIQVIGTATTPTGATIQHTATVTLTVQ